MTIQKNTAVPPDLFSPGLAAVIELQGYPQTRFTTFFRGCKNNSFLIIDHPSQNGRIIPLADDTQCILRFIREGDIIGFKCRILSIVRNPAPLVFLTYPRSVESSRLRKNDRYPVQIECVLSPNPLKGQYHDLPRSTVLNLSMGGCLIESPKALEIDQTAYLTLFIPERKPVLDLEIEIKRSGQQGAVHQLGAAFPIFWTPTMRKSRASSTSSKPSGFGPRIRPGNRPGKGPSSCPK